MPTLPHPRPGVMNHQSDGPTCFMTCVRAVQEFYKNGLLTKTDGQMYAEFVKYHAAATTPANHLKHALNIYGQHFDGEQAVDILTNEANIYATVIVPRIAAGNPIICGVRKAGAPYGHAFLIYGESSVNQIDVADPILGAIQMPMTTIKQGYAGNPAYVWQKLFFTKR